MASPPKHEEPGSEQPFISHLVELRDRLIRMGIAILLVFFVLFPFSNSLYIYVAAPLMAQLPEGTTMIATQVASPFLTPFKLALVSAIFFSMPYLLFQLWAFVAPGLYQHEKRFAIPLLVTSILLFYLGMAFAYYIVFPLVFAFLTGTAPDGVAVMTDIAHYLDFVLTLFFAFGAAFEIPIATILLVSVGITTPENLAKKRPYVIVGVFVAGMLLTPPDVISQTLLAFPMWILFEFGIFFSRFFQKQREASEEADDRTEDFPAGAAGAGASAGGGPAPTPPGEGLGPKSGGDGVVGREISGGDPFEVDRFAPMTEEEMETELDSIEAEEDIELAAQEDPDPVEEKLRQVKDLREREDHAGARRLLYEILEDGDDEQRYIARNILAQLDTP